MRNRITVAALAAVAAAGAVTAVSWSTAPESTGAAVTLTGAETTDLPDLQTSMAEADKAIANLAEQDIWGRTIFAYQQSIQQGFTEGVDRLVAAEAVSLNGTTPPADDPGVGFSNAALANAIGDLDDIEQHMPAIPQDGIPLSAQLVDVPDLVFDEVKMFGVDYTQVLPAALVALADTLVVEFS